MKPSLASEESITNGPPVAVDPGGDVNGNTNMDLLELYVTEDADRKVRLPTLIAVFTC